jgi:tetratricopeptide (TPR) repeat protein
MAAAASLLTVYAYGTRERNEVWRSEETLWRDVTIKSPRNGRGLMNYGLTLMAKGDFPGALDNFQRALVFTPAYPALEINLGVVNGSLRRDEEAERHFRRAVSLAPSDVQAHFHYARWLNERARTTEALPHLKTALTLNPVDLGSRHLLMQIYQEQRNWPLLRAMAEETLHLVPGDGPAYRYLLTANSGVAQPFTVSSSTNAAPTPEDFLNLSAQHYQSSRYAESIDFAKKALALRPGYAEAYNNMAAAHASMKQWSDAIRDAREAVRLKPDFQLAKNNLAWAEREKATSERARR